MKVTVEYKAVLGDADIRKEAFKHLKSKVVSKFNTSVEMSSLSELQVTYRSRALETAGQLLERFGA